MRANAMIVCLAVGLVACGGGGSSPTAPPPVVIHTVSYVRTIPLEIPSNSFNRASLFVDVAGVVTDVKVSVRATTARDAAGACDLFFTLRHPDGTAVLLNVHNTSAPLCSTAVFIENFPPTYEPLSRLFGKPARGSWFLEVGNEAHFGGPALLESWRLEVTARE